MLLTLRFPPCMCAPQHAWIVTNVFVGLNSSAAPAFIINNVSSVIQHKVTYCQNTFSNTEVEILSILYCMEYTVYCIKYIVYSIPYIVYCLIYFIPVMIPVIICNSNIYDIRNIYEKHGKYVVSVIIISC